MSETPYNPLDKLHLGESVANAILQSAIHPLPPAALFLGAGVYAIYYTGDFPAYAKIAEHNLDGRFGLPIYVGKAIPRGGRVGTNGIDMAPGRTLYDRLREHAESVEQATNLEIADFHCRYLVVDDIWIPLTESVLIQRFSPLWNTTLAGYGNHAPGGGRAGTQKPPWDTIHPGRPWATNLQPNRRTVAEIEDSVRTAVEALPPINSL